MKLKVKKLSLLEDLGEILTSDGRKIKPHRLYRSSSLIKIDKKGEERLINKYHIKKCVDFRTDDELEGFPELQDSEIEYYHFPCLENHENSTVTKENRLRILKEISSVKKGALERMKVFYSLLVSSTKAQKAYRNFVDVLLAAKDDEAVVFHCTQGKDRTGVAMMLLLTMLGVDKELILKRYMKYNKFRRNFRFWVAVGVTITKSPKLALSLDRLIATRKVYLDTSYRVIEEKHGTIENYIRNIIGVSDNEIKLLRTKYLY